MNVDLSVIHENQGQQLTTCDVCGNPGPFRILVSEDPSGNEVLRALGVSARTYTTVLCTACGWIFKPALLKAEQLNRLYSLLGGENTYFQDLDPGNARSRDLYNLLRKFVDVTTRLRILDIGGGVGQVCKVFAEYGHDVHVLDINQGVPAHSAIKMHSCALEDFHSDRPFDLVILSHILEHVWYPTALLERAKAITRNGGYLYLEVPFELYTPFVFRKLGDPCHVGYFTLATLCRLLDKTGLVSIFAERALGAYNARRIMILRALAQRPEREGAYRGTNIQSGWRKAVLEMAHPVQVCFVLSVLLKRLRYLIAGRQ